MCYMCNYLVVMERAWLLVVMPFIACYYQVQTVPTAVEAPVRTVGATEGPGGVGDTNKIVRELGPVAIVIPARATPKLRINNF